MDMKRSLICCLLAASAISGCGGTATSAAVQRDVAERFAAAVLRGDPAGAHPLLASADEAALMFLVRRAAAPWRAQHASIQLPARRTGTRWAVRYAGKRTYRDGRFETETGDLVVYVAGAGVRFFVFENVRMRFSTHHDAQLLPSNR